MKSQTRRIISAAALFLTALALQRAATAPWGEGGAADGTRYRVSPIGLSHVVAPREPLTPTVDCRWWPRVGDPSLCAVAKGGEAEYARLRLAYPALQVALWLSIAALLLQALRIPRGALAHVLLSAAVFALVATAGVVVTRAAPRALAVLQGVDLRFSSLGFILAAIAATLAAASTLLVAERATPVHPEPK